MKLSGLKGEHVITVFFGLPGTGKTTIAKLFSKKTNSELISSDTVRMKFFPKEDYTESGRMEIYSKMGELSEKFLLEGKSVVLDATFQLPEFREIVFSLEKKFRQKPLFLLCSTGEKKVIERLARRNYSKSDSRATEEIYRQLKKGFNLTGLKYHEIDSSLPKSAALGMALSFAKVEK